MNTNDLLKWNAQGTVPPQSLLDGGYANLSTPDATHFNALMYNIFSSLKVLGDESNDSQRATNYALSGDSVELSASTLPKFTAMTSTNGEGNYSTQTVTEDFYRGRVLLSDASATAFPVNFRGSVVLGEGAQLTWDKSDTNLSVPYTASLDVLKETSDFASMTIAPATKSQPYIVEQFKVLSTVDTGAYNRISFTFRVRKTEGQDTTSPVILAYLLQVTPTTATGTKTTLGVTGMSVTVGSVAKGFAQGAVEASVPKLASIATINISSYAGRPCSFSTTLSSASATLGLPEGTYFGIHVKSPKSVVDKTYGTDNAQIMTDGNQLYFRKFTDSAVSSAPFAKSPTMTDVSELLKVYAKTSEVNSAIASALQNYYTKTEANNTFTTPASAKTIADNAVASVTKRITDTVGRLVSDDGQVAYQLVEGDDLSFEMWRYPAGAVMVQNKGYNIINSPFATTVGGSSNEPFTAIIAQYSNNGTGVSGNTGFSFECIAWGSTGRVAVLRTSSSTASFSKPWEIITSASYVDRAVNYTRDDLGNREVLVWQGSLTSTGTTATVDRYRKSLVNPSQNVAVEPAWVHFVMDAYGGNRYTFRCPWKPKGYLTEPTGNFGLNTTNIVDAPTYDTSGNITAENVYLVEMRVNMVVNPSNSNQFIVSVLSNDHAPINTATKNIGKVSRDSGNFTMKGIIFEYDTPNYV